MSNLIPDSMLKDTCLIGQGVDCCRYIACGVNGFECAKHDESLKDALDANVTLMTAKSDNCNGLK